MNQLICEELSANPTPPMGSAPEYHQGEEDLLKRAPMDATIHGDLRVLNAMLESETRYVLSVDYFACGVQREVRSHMRKVLATWMCEVTEEQGCEEIVFPTAMNLLDRYLAKNPLKKCQLQLLGAVCLLIAAKMRQCRPISIDSLAYYTDYSVTTHDIMAWELLVLTKLDWDVSSVLPNDFVDHLLLRLESDSSDISPKNRHTIRRHANTFISLCAIDYGFSRQRPSLIAAAAVAAAIQGLRWCVAPSDLVNTLSAIIHQSPVEVTACMNSLERLMSANVDSLQMSTAFPTPPKTPQATSVSLPSISTFPSGNGKLSPLSPLGSAGGTFQTPTDVQDIVL